MLKPEATEDDITDLVEEGARLGVYAVCVSPTMVKHAAKVANGRLKVATVAGFPSGSHTSEVKAAEARQAVADGAEEVDMVIDLGKAKKGDFEAVQQDIEFVRAAVPDAILKVIIESATLTDKEIVKASMAAELAGADFVKTSTGFHPAGGATPHAVGLMSDTVGDRLGVKASGGVRTLADANVFIEQGATRLGMSGTAAVISAFGITDDSDDDDAITSGDNESPVIGVGITETGAADY